MLCPKCHQPIEDETESYICCAGETLSWRCGRCGKVSEGFAFPYGHCPLCGGPLERAGAHVPDSEAEIEAIRTAFEIELGGRAFYAAAAAEADDAAAADLFRRLAQMETEHIATLARRYHAAVPPATPAILPLDPAASVTPTPGQPVDAAALFRQAIAFEQRAVAFFTGRSQRAGIGEAERSLYRELAAEEREHAAMLATEFDRWRQGKPGLL